MNTRLGNWLGEFGTDWSVPEAVEKALIDTSWHNDMAPTFIRHDDDLSVPLFVLWVNHPDPLKRELPMKRFLVSGGSDGVDLLETEDAEEALRFMLNLTMKPLNQ